jgi:coenzyme F420-reducing hydrogenase beta subunit
MKKILFSVLASGLLFAACSNKPTTTPAPNQPAAETGVNAAASSMASTNRKGAAKEQGYKTLASFKKGQTAMDLTQLADLQNADASLVVLYESGAVWAADFVSGDFKKTGSDKLNGLMSSYELSISKHFEIDDINEGIVLDGKGGKISSPIEAAREISLVDGVIMVEVKETPKNPDATAGK